MAAKRSASDAGLEVENPHDPKAMKPRMGVSPCMVVKDGSDFMSAFCSATGTKPFFEWKEESQQKLMHAATVTPCNGYVFFEDIDTNTFAESLKVPFGEYRANDTEHVSLHLNCPDAEDIEANMLAYSVGDRQCKSVVAVGKVFWGATFGIVKDIYGVLWSLAKKGEGDAEVGPQPPGVRASVCVPDAGAYLAFLRKVFGDSLMEEEVCSDDSGVVHAELLLRGSGLTLDRLSAGDAAANATKAAGLESYVQVSMTVPTGKAKQVAQSLMGLGASVVSEVQLKFYGQVQGRVRLPSGIYVGVSEPPMEDGPSKADIKAYVQIGEKHGWDYVCTIKKLPFTRYVGVRSADKVPIKELQQSGFFGDAFKMARQAVGEHAAGPAMAIYHTAEPEKMLFTVTAGFPVSEDFKLESSADGHPGSQVYLGEVHEKAQTCCHTALAGSYENLPKAWGALGAWHGARGCKMEPYTGICGVEMYTCMGGSCGGQPQGGAAQPAVTDIFMPAPVVDDA